MKSTIKPVIAALALALSTNAGIAMADAFAGPYIGAGLSVNKMSTKFSYYYSENTGFTESGQASFGGDKFEVSPNLSAGYAMNFGRFNLAGELSYQRSYGESTPFSYSEPGYSESDKMELTKGVAVSILPGFRVGKETLIYGRLGYVRAKFKGTYSNSEGFTESESAKVRGLLYGIGMKHAFTPSISALVEYQAVNFKNKTIFSETGSCGVGCTFTDTESIKPSSNGVLVGMQYSF